MNSWQEAQLHALSTAESEEDVVVALTRAARDLGFDYWAYGLRVPVPITRPKIFMVNNYPQDWKDRYAQENYIAVDPTVAHALNSVLPLRWSEEVFASCPAFWEEARARGLRFGWAQPCYSAKGIAGLLTLARSHDELSGKELMDREAQMSWLTQAAHEILSRWALRKIAPETTTHLSPREIEVLRWTAEGKTSSEIGQIMNITERTVNFHVNNVIAKLNASNKTAATIKAAILGLL